MDKRETAQERRSSFVEYFAGKGHTGFLQPKDTEKRSAAAAADLFHNRCQPKRLTDDTAAFDAFHQIPLEEQV